MSNKLEKLFHEKTDLLSIYFTAGYPNLHDTIPILKALEENGVDFVEVGMPYSDPLADGTTIQNSSQVAIKNGMKLDLLFDQLTEAQSEIQLPIVYMGYLNQLMQYGLEKFCKKCVQCQIDALIIPDLPMDVYEKEYKKLFDEYDLSLCFLISPQSSKARIKQADRLSHPFLYQVSSNAITGAKTGISNKQKEYFKRIEDLNLQSPTMIGFGISDQDTFTQACSVANGAIIGSAFIKAISQENNLNDNIANFIKTIRS